MFTRKCCWKEAWRNDYLKERGTDGWGDAIVSAPHDTHTQKPVHTKWPTACLRPMALSVCCPSLWVMAGWRCRKEGLFLHPVLGQGARTYTHIHAHLIHRYYIFTNNRGAFCFFCVAAHHSSHPEFCSLTKTAASPVPYADHFCLSAQTPFLLLSHQLVGYWIELRAQVHVTCGVLVERFEVVYGVYIWSKNLFLDNWKINKYRDWERDQLHSQVLLCQNYL